jgi:hypothetical protein
METPTQADLEAKGYGYQLYKDTTETTYCSSKKFKNHDEGDEWIKACLKAHPGTSVSGKPWVAEKQPAKATIWPGRSASDQ